MDALRRKERANVTDGFVPIGGKCRELKPRVANPNGHATERELTHNDRQIVRSASIVLGVIHEAGCMYPSSTKRNVEALLTARIDRMGDCAGLACSGLDTDP